MKRLGFFLVLCVFVETGAAATASGRNWRITIDRLECQAGVMTLATRIRYLGPQVPVESPVIRLVDAKGAPHAPKSLVWIHGSKGVAEWLSAGGLTLLQPEELGAVQIRFEPREAAGELKLEFGDIGAFALSKNGCEGVLNPQQLKTPAQPPRKEGKSSLRLYRGLYPCRAPSGSSVTDAQYPPYLPAQLLVFGHGYLPNAREIALPMGLAPAQSYAFSGMDDRKAVEALALRVAGSDFPRYGASRYFAYDWGVQRSASGNELQSVGIYELRACPK